MTDVRTALRDAAMQFQQAGIATPAVDARLLMAYVLDTEPTQLFMMGDAEAPRKFDSLVARRVQREPLQHIMGHTYFYGLPMFSAPGAFIPRPETELMVQWAEQWIQATGARTVLDLCTGPGTIALALACGEHPLQITAVDIDEHALELAQKNAAQLRDKGLLTGTVEFIQADISIPGLPEKQQWEGTFDLVICNPPYVPEGPVEPEVQADPHHAVFSGQDGMELMPHVVSLAEAALHPQGGTAIEHDDSTSTQVQNLLARNFTEITAHRDLADRPRFVTASKL